MSALKTDFAGEKGDMFALALKTGLLTVLTLGLYRFWAKTRLRRWYWSAVRPGGMGLEYLGTAHEKIMGFFVAIIALAIYIAVFNLVALEVTVEVMHGGISPQTLILAAIPLLGFPVFFMARYRTRHYILSRTTWLGVRFGMDPGAWGYAWRSCMYWLLTILTLGLFWPLKTYQLEKYLTDRSWYGTAQFKQHGHPFMLYGLAVPFLALIAAVLYVSYEVGRIMLADTQTLEELVYVSWLSLSYFLLVPLIIIAGIYFRVASIRAMACRKELGDGMKFEFNPKTRKLLRIRFFGIWLTSFLLSFVSSIVLGLLAGVMILLGYEVDASLIYNTPPGIAILAGLLSGLLTFILWTVFWHAFVTFPSARHMAETLVIEEPALLRGIRQKQEERRSRTGLLSEALDVGGAF